MLLFLLFQQIFINVELVIQLGKFPLYQSGRTLMKSSPL